VSVGKRPRLCTLGEPVQPPPTPPNDRPLPEKPDHRPHVTTQILGEWYSALVDTGAAGSFIGDSLRDKCYRHLRPVTPTIQSARMANGQVDTITEAYWISLKIGTRTIQGKFHHLPHLPSDLVLGIDVLRQYPFSIDLKGGSASLQTPAAVDVVQPTPTHPASQVSNSPPLILSPDEDQRLRQFLSEELPLVDTVRGLTPLAQHEIRFLHPEPVKQHDFDIRYRKGVLNRVADALSRQPATAKDETTPEGLFTLEDAPGCSWYTKMRREVEKNPAAYPDYCIQGDRLHRHFWDMSDSTEPELSDPWKLCVPKPARAAVLKECHDNPTAGHLGIAKTTARLALRYYWPGMFREAAQYVRKCPSCQRYKTPQQQPPGKMYPTPNRQPWETVSTDLVGPLPRSSRGNCYVVVMQDRFTKWVQCRAVRKATARAVTQALYEEVITRFGCPVTVISDNGTQYSGTTFRTLLQELGITHRLTPPYTPQANPVERTNKTLKTMVAQFCEADQKKWDARLPELMFALNTSRHESTKYTPAMLNFGRELVIPNAVHRPAPGNAAADPPADTAADEVKEADDAVHHSERLRLLKDTFELVRVNLARAFAKQSKYYNLRHREWRCHLGDRVLKRDHPLSSGAKGFAAKLAPKYSGPYTITKVLSPVVYNLQSPSGQKILRAHIKDLKPYQPPDPPADIGNILQDAKSTVATAAKRSAERPPAAKSKTGRPGRPPERSTAGRPRDPGAVPTSTAEAPGRKDGDPDHPERPERACSATAGPDASRLNCQRGSLLAPADRNPIDLDASVALNLDHRRPSRNHRSRHHGVAYTGELSTRRPARADTGGPPETPTVSPRDAPPTAPPPKNEASAHGGTRAPVCPARWDATGSRKPDREPGTRSPPPLKPGHHRQQEDTFNLTRFSKKPF
jgi:transposase InsO family protein